MMIRKGGSVVGSLWRFFVATFQSRNPHPASPRRSRTATTYGAMGPSFRDVSIAP